MQLTSTAVSTDLVRKRTQDFIQQRSNALFALNQQIHQHPETAFLEHKAHDAICDFLELHGFDVTRHAYGLDTSFEAHYGFGGRCVNFNAEYDALPGIGHACGHNLIATAAITGFIGLANALQESGIKGRVQLLGTPAEEDGGGKILLLNAGAYENVDASLMIHPMSESQFVKSGSTGAAGQSSLANVELIAEYHGRPAHAAANPWDGLNALDAIVSTYNNVSMLRQQIHPNNRIHGCILEAPKVTNVTPQHTKIMYSIRSATVAHLDEVKSRVRNCIEAGALATGCEVSTEEGLTYSDLLVNEPLCGVFKEEMSFIQISVLKLQKEKLSGSTDMGNISKAMPGLHAMIGIPTPEGSLPHDEQFATAAGTREAHNRAVSAGVAMAMTGWSILTSEETYLRIRKDFEKRGTRG